MTEWNGRRVTVVGLGVSGFAAARALEGLGARVRVTESGLGPGVVERAEKLRSLGVEVELGSHDVARLDADVAVLSPGVPPSAPVVAALRAAGTELISEVELAYRMAECDFLAVTGTNGKTTTTSLLAKMLAEGGVPSIAAGNIGVPLIDAIERIGRGGAIAVEVSSFQLETIDQFHPRVAVLLNVAEDHTDWHGSFEAYVRAKARLIENQGPGDVFLPNLDDARAMTIAHEATSEVVPFSARCAPPGGIGMEDGHLVYRGRRLLAAAKIPLPGAAGIEDVAAAAGAALEYGIEAPAVVHAIEEFHPLPHRLARVAEIDGVAYIDDSKATNPHATLTAVRGLSDVVLIAGGRSKGIDLTPLAATVPAVRAVVALGEAAKEVVAVFEGLVPVRRASSMEEAVHLARSQAIPGGSVLLSPGCASLDMYESYAARGEAFAGAVREVLEERGEPGEGSNGHAQ